MYVTQSIISRLRNYRPKPRGVVPGGAGGAMTPPDFGRTVKPISTRRGGGQILPNKQYWPPRIFRPSYGPESRLQL